MLLEALFVTPREQSCIRGCGRVQDGAHIAPPGSFASGARKYSGLGGGPSGA